MVDPTAAVHSASAENDASTRASALRICHTGDLATLLNISTARDHGLNTSLAGVPTLSSSRLTQAQGSRA